MAKYTQYYNYLTSQGVMVPDTSVVLGEVQTEMQEIFGQDLDLGPTTVQGRIIELLQRSRTFTIQSMAAISNMFNLSRASGFMLDDIGALFLISRQPATYTTTSVNLSGVAGTVIPQGTRLQTTSGEIFALQNQYTIGTPTPATFVAQTAGPVACPPNTLTVILDPVNGLETANNPGQPTLGENTESDDAFRKRIQASLNINSIAMVSAIKANLEALPGVIGSYVYDNYTNQSTTIDEIVVPAHSILVVVEGGDPQQIADTLYATKTGGCGYLASSTNENITIETETVIDPSYGTSYEVKFARPELVNIVVQISVAQQNYTGTDLTSAVQNAIIAWAQGDIAGVDGVKIGGNVSPFEIAAAVSTVIPEIFITNVLVGIQNGAAPAATTISLDDVQKANITQSNITVNIVDNAD